MAENFISLVDRSWVTLNALNPPDLMPEGHLTTADNIILQGGAGGAIRIRPGVRAQLTASLGSPFYESFIFTKADGTRTLVAVAGGTATGRVYAWDRDSTALPVPLTAMGFFNAPSVQMTRLGPYLYVSSNVDGNIWRTDLSSTFESLAGLSQPNYTAAATATNRTINLLNLTGSWHADATAAGTPSLALLDPNFTAVNLGGQTSGSFLSTSAWMVYGGTVDTNLNTNFRIDGSSPTADRFVLFDDQPGGIHAWVKMTAGLKTNVTGIGSVTRRAVHYRTTFTYRSAFVNDAVDVTMVIYDATQAEIARQTQTVSNTNTGAASQVNLLFTFGSVDDTSIGSVSIAFQGTKQNTPGAQGGGTGVGGPYVGHVSIVPVVVPSITFSPDGSGIKVANVGDTASISTSSLIPIGQVRLSYDLGSAMNLSTVQGVAFGFDQYPAYPLTGIRARLGLRDATAGVVRYTNDFQYITDQATGKVYATTDLSSTTGSLTAARYLDFHFEGDANYAVPNTSNLPFIRLGGFTFAGNLSVGGIYAYRFVEETGQAISGSLLSSPAGYPSQYIVASQIKATGEITASNGTVPTNTSADIVVFRVGGTFSDALYRKVARFSPTAAASGTYWTWSTANGVFVFDDYTPDSQLISSGDVDFILLDHTTAPTGAYAIGVHANRLAALAADGLHISQLQTGRASGMYWDLANDPSAPNAEQQGFYTQISGADGVQSSGPPARLINYLNRMWLFFENAIWEFGGSSQDDFQLARFAVDEGRGLIANRAYTIFNNRIFFLSSDGLRILDGYRSERISEIIDGLLNPAGMFLGAPLSATAYQNAFVVSHAGRVYLSAPTAGSSDVAAVYCYDARGGGAWTRWTISGFYNGATFASSKDADDLVLLDKTGMIYYVGANYGDTALKGAAVTPVAMTAASRWFTHEQQWLRCQRFSLAMTPADAATTAMFVLTGQNPANNQYTATCYFPVGETDLSRNKVPRRNEGRYAYWAVYVTETAAVVIPRIEIEASLGRQT